MTAPLALPSPSTDRATRVLDRDLGTVADENAVVGRGHGLVPVNTARAIGLAIGSRVAASRMRTTSLIALPSASCHAQPVISSAVSIEEGDIAVMLVQMTPSPCCLG